MNFIPTKLGNKFLDRVEKFSGNQEKLKDEFAQILLVEGTITILLKRLRK